MAAEDQTYLRKRLTQEQTSAAAAERPEVRRIHLDLAALYAVRLRDAEGVVRPCGWPPSKS